MKVCPTCGKQNRDTAKFCTGCGASILEVIAVPGEPAPEPAPAASSIYNAPAPAAAPAPAPAPAPARPAAPYVARTPAQERLKKLAGSKLALVICIAFTLMLVFSVGTRVIVPSALGASSSDFLDVVKDAGIGDLLEDAFNIDASDINDAIDEVTDAGSGLSDSVTRITSASTSGISLLFAVALWIIYGGAKKEGSVCCGNTGLWIIRVLKTIGLVVAIIFAVVIAVGIVLALFMTIREGYEDYTLLLYILAGFTALVYVIMFCFLGGCISTVKRYISVSQNRSGRSRISGFAALLLFIGGLFSALFVITTIGAGIALSSEYDSAAFIVIAVIMAVSSIVRAVYQFALSSFIFRSKKALKTV